MVLEFTLDFYNWDHGVKSIARVPEYPLLWHSIGMHGVIVL